MLHFSHAHAEDKTNTHLSFLRKKQTPLALKLFNLYEAAAEIANKDIK
jgi:hypothetical protein